MKGKRNNPGFTLLEVMIAVAILAVSLMALMSLQSQALLASARAEKISISTWLAQQKMAEILLEIEKGVLKGEFPDEKEEQGNFENQFPDFFWRLKITRVELPMPEGVQDEMMLQAMKMLTEELSKSTREVRLTVGWEEFEEEEIGITVATHLINPLGAR